MEKSFYDLVILGHVSTDKIESRNCLDRLNDLEMNNPEEIFKYCLDFIFNLNKMELKFQKIEVSIRGPYRTK